PWMFFKLSWIFPLVVIGFFLIMAFLVARRLWGPAEVSSFLKKEKRRKLSKEAPSDKIPQALKEAGWQVLENLDWEIRFLEKQCLEVEDPKERKKIQVELKRKREEYRATVDRLEP
ncbi:MAG: hypothetical protein L0Y56_12860, partial [Nitrospira sp.]|nr:hypothetical protein [Nitrospira sp.]